MILQEWHAFILSNFWPSLQEVFSNPLEIVFAEIHSALRKKKASLNLLQMQSWLEQVENIQQNSYSLINSHEAHVTEYFGVLATSVLHDMRHAAGNLTAQLSSAIETIILNDEIDSQAIPLLENIVRKNTDGKKAWQGFLGSRQFYKETYVSQYEVLHLEQQRPVTLQTLTGHIRKRTAISKKQFDVQKKKPDVRIEIHNNDSETEAKIVQQPILLTEVINELVVNAIKVLKQGTNDGKIEVHTSRTATDLCITVQDNGPGFTTIDTTTTKSLGGTGQGLTKIQEDINILGGTFNMHSSANGALCTVTIPLHTEE